jgi:AcrR family transcriptional regulator
MAVLHADTPRGSYAKGERTRRTILDAALAVFAEHGYQGGSLREVAARVGITDAGLLHHFPHKSALLSAVLERRDEQAREDFTFEDVDGRTVLGSFLQLVESNASAPGVVELYCHLSAEATAPDHPAHAYFQQHYDEVLRVATRAFLDLAGRGELRPGVEPASAARATVALMDGLQIQWLLNRDSVDMAAELRRWFSSVVATGF